MTESVIQKTSKEFALKIIILVQELQDKNQYVLAKQILRSGTSIGANVSESFYASSTADFINKLNIAQKEANETKYWLELLYEAKIIAEAVYNELVGELMQLIRMLGKSIVSNKNKI